MNGSKTVSSRGSASGRTGMTSRCVSVVSSPRNTYLTFRGVASVYVAEIIWMVRKVCTRVVVREMDDVDGICFLKKKKANCASFPLVFCRLVDPCACTLDVF